jgi:hypothetical protein
MCSNPAAIDGTACNDGNACTQADACLAGVCTGSNPVACTALDQCHVAGTCDPKTGMCSNPAASDGTTCSDGNACTQTDTCQGGSCAGANPVVCTALDQCHVVGTCDPGSGVCSNPNATNGTVCTSSTPCTLSATCQAGTCAGTACPSGQCGTSLTAFSGVNSTGWSMNGTANYDTGSNTVVLCDGTAKPQAGSLIYNDLITADAFTFAFDFKLSTTAPYSRADGIGFVMQTNGANALGQGYGGFGFQGLTGYGVELDIFDSGPCDPGNGNHASVDLLSACSSNIGIPSPIATSPDLFGIGVGDIGDGSTRSATITLANGQLSVVITDNTGTPVTVGNLQNVALPGFVSGTPYYLGLTGGTGSNGFFAREEIANVRLTFGATHCL